MKNNNENVKETPSTSLQNELSISDKKCSRKKMFKIIIILIFIVIGLLGYVVPIVVKSIKKENKNNKIPDRVVLKIDYLEEATKAITLPFEWKIIRSSTEKKGFGLRLVNVKNSFPHNNNIMVTLTGKLYFLTDNANNDYDMDMRLLVNVSPDNGILRVMDIKIDNWYIYDALAGDVIEAKSHEEEILLALHKQFSFAFTQIPKEATRIKEMTLERLTFYID